VVTLWNSQDMVGRGRDSTAVHRDPIVFVEWAPNGHRFVTGGQVRQLIEPPPATACDVYCKQNGTIGVWRAIQLSLQLL
jgi:hypothetical protein